MRVSLEQAIAELKKGEVVAIPTETVYGLAADATNDSALKKIFALKQRPADHPLIVHIGNISQVNDWVKVFPELAVKLAKTFWPGALTLVLPAKDHVSRVVRGGEATVALRVPSHPVALALLKHSGLSLAAPSANLFTQLSPTTVQHVEAGLGVAVPVIDGGACTVGIESTIVSVREDGQWQLLRPGIISEADIAKVANKAALNHRALNNVNLDAAQVEASPKAPGQHALHYSPRTPLLLFEDKASLIKASQDLVQSHLTCAALLIGKANVPGCHVVTLSDQADKAAELLYSSLHDLDAMHVDRLLVELPPNTLPWAAVRDRLKRAGHQ